jgi:alpha-tubulin suppressor-like RCC1 family protein
LGIGTWTGREDNDHWRYHTLQKVVFPDDVRIAGVTASMGCSIAWTEDGKHIILLFLKLCIISGKAYGFGYDTAGQLGLGITEDDDKMVSLPRRINSAHLEDYQITAVSLADQHAVFLAKRVA